VLPAPNSAISVGSPPSIMGLDPVRQFLRQGCLGVSVIGGAKDGDEALRFAASAGRFWISQELQGLISWLEFIVFRRDIVVVSFFGDHLGQGRAENHAPLFPSARSPNLPALPSIEAS
jgi:hypothetical protein